MEIPYSNAPRTQHTWEETDIFESKSFSNAEVYIVSLGQEW